MNCAHVTIAGAGTLIDKNSRVSFARRPPIFAANVGNECDTPESRDVVFPQPGPAVTFHSLESALPNGRCVAEYRIHSSQM